MKKILTKTALIAMLILLGATWSEGMAQDPRTYLKKSLKAYGKWKDVKTLSYEVSGKRDAGAQGKRYKSGEQQAYSARRAYHLPEKKLYETNLNTFPGGYAFHFATIVQDTLAYNYDIDGTRGGRVYNSAGKAIAENRYKVVNNHIAYFKVKDLQESTDSLIILESNATYKIIRRLNVKATPIADYYFANKTNLLEKVVADQAGQQVELQYSNYSKTAGRLENTEVKVSVNGKTSYEEKVNVTRTNFVFDNSTLEVPKDYKPNKAEGPSKPKEIAKDIYLIERLAGDRNVLFVNMDDYITVIEAPISSELSKQVIQKIREVVPDKPIKYVFTTHFHSDHTGGLRQYAHLGAELMMAAPTQAYVKDLLAAPQPDDFGKSGATAAQFKTITGKYVLQDDNHLIEFYEVPNSHCDGMALAYFPKERLIYQGDLLSVPLDGTLPFAIEVTQDMKTFLDNNGISFKRMIGHHGHNQITPAMLEQIMLKGKGTANAK
ncbi:MBL fold metallo-hydrolase [Pontibacter cellulosilyticus]|uniref:MBL fold metallo-hydrolase n=1 Tax=Pontibacter cellulosilyticus TaxID=1720253 RepID=A0A923N5J1_9BACT|nr:MBL fold metallo-hydrolase [Pontibacter cellulosilyticus]MBC5992234.1 MBL fold metallo-hydrolase [Pontibacter cellulosilyticus]